MPFTSTVRAGDLPPDAEVIQILLPGEDMDPARRGGKTVLVQSSAHFVCDTEQVWRDTIKAIRASDEHLRNRPDEQMLWDWKKTDGGAPTATAPGWVELGVAWYDLAFFQAKKDVWFGPDHLALYATIGVPLEHITVEHWLSEAAVASLTAPATTTV
jgi:hypothetical protein